VLDPQSEILAALYRRQPADAHRLAETAHALTIWEAAALGRETSAARLLAAEPALANAVAPDGHVPLALAAFFGHPAMVTLLLAHGADPAAAARNDMKVQPLHAAVAARSLECVTVLLDAGVDPNARQQHDYTPLMGAASAGRDDLVDLLLARGADPALVSDDGKTAATIAAEHGHAALAARLAA
jgi:ankyrin repeat protein